MNKFFLLIIFALGGCNKTYTYETANEDVKGAYNLQELIVMTTCTQAATRAGSTPTFASAYCRCCTNVLKSKFDFSPFKTQNLLEESNNRVIGAMLSPSEINACLVQVASQVKTTVSM
jgi:hypothetical protein